MYLPHHARTYLQQQHYPLQPKVPTAKGSYPLLPKATTPKTTKAH